MAVPDRAESARVLLELDPPDWHLNHVSAVAEIAAFLAARVAARGMACKVQLVESAALLHDVDKLLPRTELDHGEAGARWLTKRGYAELAPAVASHPARRLSDGAWFARWLRHSSIEERIVSYADKRAGQRLESLEERFADWRQRYPEHEQGIAGGLDLARVLERETCAAAGIAPQDVRRLRWVDVAVGAARETQAHATRSATPR